MSHGLEAPKLIFLLIRVHFGSAEGHYICQKQKAPRWIESIRSASFVSSRRAEGPSIGFSYNMFRHQDQLYFLPQSGRFTQQICGTQEVPMSTPPLQSHD